MPENPANPDSNSCMNTNLDVKTVDKNPLIQFHAWFTDAMNSGVLQPDAMFLATADKNGIPSGRIVLLKGYNTTGFLFFTNYQSRKGSEILQNPFAAIVFHWKEIKRQVRISGKVEKVSDRESDEYFSSRPLESKISAIISEQSSVIPGRDFLETRFNDMKQSIRDNPARPMNWGGFRIIPSSYEFWQLREHRLHDRIRYRLSENTWIIERLSP
jgi:pyridoxamine 5'-phosphate oxidase